MSDSSRVLRAARALLAALDAQTVEPFGLRLMPACIIASNQLRAALAEHDAALSREGTPEVVFVPQRESWDCGVACLAMVAGISYEAALDAIGETGRTYGPNNKGLPSRWMPNYLGALGLAVRHGFGKLGPEWWRDGLTGLRLLNVSGHYVVALPDNRVLDPAQGETDVTYYPQAFDVWEVHRLPLCAPPEVRTSNQGGTE